MIYNMELLNTIYHDILEGEKYINKLQLNNYDNNEINHISLTNSTTYFPKEIQNYIKSNIKHKITYSTRIYEKIITINLYTTSKYHNTKINNIIFNIILIIYVLNKYSSKQCSKKLNINIYLTPFLRKLPKQINDIIEPIHVNGGFSTSGCYNTGDITIYREEEWYKVLIHELFHNLNLDFATRNISKWREILKKEIGIKSKYNIYECYCETWARILNICIISFKKSSSKSSFHTIFNKLIYQEQLFSILQCNKIYKRMKSNINYKENTNAICYYVFTGALMLNYKGFLYWCNLRGKIKFINTIKNIDSFLYLILNEYNSVEFTNSIEFINTIKDQKYKRSLRMTIADTL